MLLFELRMEYGRVPGINDNGGGGKTDLGIIEDSYTRLEEILKFT